MSIKRAFPIILIIAFLSGLIGQFVWKMIYFPEPVIPVVLELAAFTALAGVAIWWIWSIK